jgi:hypothetical protein
MVGITNQMPKVKGDKSKLRNGKTPITILTFLAMLSLLVSKSILTGNAVGKNESTSLSSSTSSRPSTVWKQEQWYTDMLAKISNTCKHASHFFHHFLPHKRCLDMVRVGRCGDGYKLVCMDDFIGRNTKRAQQSSSTCIVYSFGSSDDSCFEADMANRTDCEIHIFDPTSSYLRDQRWTYHPYGLTGENPNITKYWNWRTQKQSSCDNCPMKNLKDIMEELGHSWIDILKVDIDGAEWRSFDYIYQQMHTVPSSQIQVELTGLDITDQPDSLAGGTLGVYKLWSNLINDGFRIFHVEANVGTCEYRERDRSASFEYALWR